jgi:hypothetical protein
VRGAQHFGRLPDHARFCFLCALLVGSGAGGALGSGFIGMVSSPVCWGIELDCCSNRSCSDAGGSHSTERKHALATNSRGGGASLYRRLG